MTNFLEQPVSISSYIVWIEKLDYFDEGIYFSNNGCHGMKKGNFSVIIATVARRKKNFYKNLNLIDSNHHCKRTKVKNITI